MRSTIVTACSPANTGSYVTDEGRTGAPPHAANASAEAKNLISKEMLDTGRH